MKKRSHTCFLWFLSNVQCSRMRLLDRPKAKNSSLIANAPRPPQKNIVFGAVKNTNSIHNNIPTAPKPQYIYMHNIQTLISCIQNIHVKSPPSCICIFKKRGFGAVGVLSTLLLMVLTAPRPPQALFFLGRSSDKRPPPYCFCFGAVVKNVCGGANLCQRVH